MILAIDTSTSVGGVALIDGDKLIASRILNVVKTHSERLMNAVHDTMSEADLNLKRDVHAIVCGIGPGSFTGVRIAVSAAKSMAYALNLPIIGVSTLDALSYAIPFKGKVVSMIDARHERVYSAEYVECGNYFDLPNRVSDFTLDSVENVVKKAYEICEDVCFVGDGACTYARLIEKLSRFQARFLPPQISVVDPVKIALIGKLKLENGLFDDAASLVPMYLRESEPVIKMNEVTSSK